MTTHRTSRSPGRTAAPSDLAGSDECRRLAVHLWDHLDGRLDAESSARLRAHVGDCLPCRRYAAFQQTVLGRLADARTDAPAAPPWLRRRVERALHEAGWRRE